MENPEQVAAVLEEAELDTEAMSVVLVAGATRAAVLADLGAATTPTPLVDVDWDESSAYSVVDVEGGVLAIELSGYADPSRDVLARLSAHGGTAAVIRTNIQAYDRFGCARDGELVFDAEQYPFVEVEQKESVPPDLRALFDSAWEDLDDDDAQEPEDAVLVGLAMVSVFTGITITDDDLRRALEGDFHQVPVLTYVT